MKRKVLSAAIAATMAGLSQSSLAVVTAPASFDVYLAGSSAQDTYKVGLTLSQTGNYLEFAKETLKDTTSLEWTNKSSQSSTTGTSQSASVTVGGPAFGYPGSTVMDIYFDTMYKTFAFELVPVEQEQLAIEGTAVTIQGVPLALTEVILKQRGREYRTYTNSKGQFRFFGNITGPATVEVVGVVQVVPQLEPAKRTVQITVHH